MSESRIACTEAACMKFTKAPPSSNDQSNAIEIAGSVPLSHNTALQGGDTTGTGKGGESIFGPTFRDELDSRLVHDGRGILSMANSGELVRNSKFLYCKTNRAYQAGVMASA